MKRILSTTILSMLVCMAFAQKANIKEARKQMDSNKFNEARQLIQQALGNEETANDQETWKTAGDIEYKVFDNENDKLLKGKLTGEKPNEELMYSSLFKTFDPYMTADSLGQLPDEKGKVKNKVRKDIITKLITSHAAFYEGGVYYNDKKDFSKAANFFARYAWDVPEARIFEGASEKINTNDSTFAIIKYYAALSAISANEPQKAISFLTKMSNEQYINNSTFKENYIYELIADEYKKLGDTIAYTNALEKGAKRFPSSNYFISNIINQFINNREPEKAVEYLNQAIANNPSCELYSVKANILSEREDFENAYSIYQKALEIDPNCERALEGLGLAYILQAQKLKAEDNSKDSKALYEKAYPLLEKFRTLLEARGADRQDIKTAIFKLRNVYYNLNMEKEFEAADKAYEAM